MVEVGISSRHCDVGNGDDDKLGQRLHSLVGKPTNIMFSLSSLFLQSH